MNPVELYFGGKLPHEVAPGEYALFLVDGVIDRADNREAWVVQTVAARLDVLPADELAQVEAVKVAALAHFGGPGAAWRDGSRVVGVGRSTWPNSERGN